MPGRKVAHCFQDFACKLFFFPPEKTPSMVRNLRVILARARLSVQEVRTLRGVITALTKGRGRVLARLARERAAAQGAAED